MAVGSGSAIMGGIEQTSPKHLPRMAATAQYTAAAPAPSAATNASDHSETDTAANTNATASQIARSLKSPLPCYLELLSRKPAGIPPRVSHLLCRALGGSAAQAADP